VEANIFVTNKWSEIQQHFNLELDDEDGSTAPVSSEFLELMEVHGGNKRF
jgi:hypothetical protein